MATKHGFLALVRGGVIVLLGVMKIGLLSLCWKIAGETQLPRGAYSYCMEGCSREKKVGCLKIFNVRIKAFDWRKKSPIRLLLRL